MLLAVFSNEMVRQADHVGRPDPQGAFKVDESLGWQNVTATVGSRTRSSSRLSKCYLAFTASCIRISTRRMVENITIQVGESRGERH